jgi:hypothetical protein
MERPQFQKESSPDKKKKLFRLALLGAVGVAILAVLANL